MCEDSLRRAGQLSDSRLFVLCLYDGVRHKLSTYVLLFALPPVALKSPADVGPNLSICLGTKAVTVIGNISDVSSG